MLDKLSFRLFESFFRFAEKIVKDTANRDVVKILMIISRISDTSLSHDKPDFLDCSVNFLLQFERQIIFFEH